MAGTNARRVRRPTGPGIGMAISRRDLGGVAVGVAGTLLERNERIIVLFLQELKSRFAGRHKKRCQKQRKCVAPTAGPAGPALSFCEARYRMAGARPWSRAFADHPPTRPPGSHAVRSRPRRRRMRHARRPVGRRQDHPAARRRRPRPQRRRARARRHRPRPHPRPRLAPRTCATSPPNRAGGRTPWTRIFPTATRRRRCCPR